MTRHAHLPRPDRTLGLGLIATIGVAIGAAGIHLVDTDDAPGVALIGILLMIGAVGLCVRIARR